MPHVADSGSVLVGVCLDGTDLGVVAPRLNHYKTMDQPIGTPTVHSDLGEDLYLSLVNVDQQASQASFDVKIMPLVWWLWFGGGVMLLGTLIAVWPSRRSDAAARTSRSTRLST